MKRHIWLILFTFAIFANRGDGQSIYWQSASGPEDADVLAIHSMGSRMFIGTLGQGVFEENGTSWTERNNGLSNLYVRALASDAGDRLYAGAGDGLVFYSDDYGTLWTQTAETGIGNIYTLAVTSTGILFAGGDGGVCKSTDEGATWEIDDMGMAHLVISDIIALPNGVLLVGTVGMGAFRSTDDGTTWVQTFAGSPDNFMSSFDTDEDGNVFAASLLGIFLSTDDGLTWSELTDPEGANVIDIEVGLPEAYFATTPLGVFLSQDSGLSWQEAGFGLGDLQVNCFGMNGTIYAGTNGGGVYKGLNPLDVDPEDNAIPLAYDLLQNYPNPFNPRTTIRFEITDTRFVILEIYDLEGSKVSTLLKETLPAGVHTTEWDATGMPSGVYFYRLEAGSFSSMRKLILLK